MRKSVPVLVGTHEIRPLLGQVTRQRAHQIMMKPSFPAPVADLMHGKVWRLSDVEEWVRQHRAGS